MPDITMCDNDECPERRFCHRHEASGTNPDRLWQSYAHFVGPTMVDGKRLDCPDLWPKNRPHPR